MTTLNVTVRRARRRSVVIASIVFLGLGLWGLHHVVSAVQVFQGKGSQFGAVFTVAFFMLVLQTVLYHSERPYTTTAKQQAELDKLHITVPVPVYNEDPGFLLQGLMSLLNQDRLPDLVYVVDDGSWDKAANKPIDYSRVRKEFMREARALNVEVKWVRTENGGKRHAQGVAIADTPDTDIYVTVDSDAILVPNAIDEVLKPFAKPKVKCVAGLVLAANVRKNLLTRLTDLWFVVGQLVDRSAASTMGAVLVNSGPLAAYRADVIRRNLVSYLNETFFGRRVEFSDDSMLTIFCLLEGKAVQQPTAFALTAMPENFSHHIRQYLRWMRGAFIRSWWRFKYLPLTGFAFWNHLIGWVQMLLSTMLFAFLFVIEPIGKQAFSPLLLLVPVSIGFAQAVRYLSISRSDDPVWSQVLTVLLSPLATLWAFTVLRVVRWYGIATCMKTGWGTRDSVEITAEPGSTPELDESEVDVVLAFDDATEKFRPVVVPAQKFKPVASRDERTRQMRPVQPVPRLAPKGSLAAAAQTLRFRPVAPPQPAQPLPAAAQPPRRPVEAERTQYVRPVINQERTQYLRPVPPPTAGWFDGMATEPEPAARHSTEP